MVCFVSYLRIVIFSVILFALQALVVVAGDGLFTSDVDATQNFYRFLIEHICVGIVVFLVFMKLAQIQVRLLYLHVFLIVILQQLIGIALLHAIGSTNPSSPLWLVDWAVLAISVLLGTEVGRRLRVSSRRSTRGQV